MSSGIRKIRVLAKILGNYQNAGVEEIFHAGVTFYLNSEYIQEFITLSGHFSELLEAYLFIDPVLSGN